MENFDLGHDKLSKRVFLDKYFVEQTFITIQSWILLLDSLIEIYLQRCEICSLMALEFLLFFVKKLVSS